MNKKQLEDTARTFGCLIDTNHSSGFNLADVWVLCGNKKERIGFYTEIGTLTTQQLISILERVSGKKIRELWTGGKGGGA